MRKLLIFLVLLVVGAGLFVQFGLGSIAKGVMETEGRAATGTNVSVDSVSFDVLKGKVTIKGLSVANPDGFEDANALAVDEISVSLNLSRTRPSLIVVDEVYVGNPQIRYEEVSGRSNLDAIQGSADGSSSDADEGTSKGPKFIVSRVEFTDGELLVLGLSVANPEIDAVMPGFVLTDIGEREGGVSAEEVAREITVAVTGRVIEAVLTGAIFDLITDPADGIKDTLGGIFGGK